MADKDTPRNPCSPIEPFRTIDHWAVALARDLLWLVAVVGGIALALWLICGTWPAVVTIESHSMEPHMNVGDLVVVAAKDRYGVLQTWAEGRAAGYRKFEDFGDVIIYRPNGADNSSIPIPLLCGGIHPIIHRAMARVETENLPKYLGVDLANLSQYYELHGGYITKGDNNRAVDQVTMHRILGVIEPVKDEWVVGKALFIVPLVGYLPLNIVWVTLIVIVTMIIHELYLRSSEGEKEVERPRKKGKVRKRSGKNRYVLPAGP